MMLSKSRHSPEIPSGCSLSLIHILEHIEGYLPWDGDERCFALRVRGDSMIGAGILSGDKVVVRPQPTAENGQIVVALLDDSATVKR